MAYTGRAMKALALVVCAVLTAGCFGYNSSAKKWSYVGDTVLVLGGGAAIAVDRTSSTEPCTTTTGACPYHAPVSGAMVAGVLLVTAGIVGIIYTITRPTLKAPSR
jgi:hypothetical protein